MIPDRGRLRCTLFAMLAALAAGVTAPAVAQDGEAGAGEASQFRFERQLRVNPFDPVALNNLAVVKAGQGRYEDAQDLLERASRLAPDSAEIRRNLERLTAWRGSAAGDAGADTPAEPDLSKLPPEPPPLWNRAPAQ